MNTSLPTNPVAGGGDFITDVKSAWAALNELSYDTGWRNISGNILESSGATVSSIYIRRQGLQTTLRVANLTLPEGKSNAQLFSLGVDTGKNISQNFLSVINERSPLFKTSSGDEFFFTHTQTALYIYFTNGRSTGPFAVEWRIIASTNRPSFLPPEA